MKKYLLSIALLLVAIPVMAVELPSNILKNERIQAAPGACLEAVANDPRIQRGATAFRNVSQAGLAVVLCSPTVDVSQNGTTAFGVVLGNGKPLNVPVTCVATIHQGGGRGPVTISRNLIVGPRASPRMTWTAGDLGNRVLVGGQVGIACSLPPGMAVQWVWTTSVGN